ncbi:MAG: hypothetical protein GTO45_13005 [Candidatus Aminicenantes bacterium]|nr:hypothetical protein [Candidatus Aminicenantes bacterium]NIM79699.1 hypothetical protein [Candidatus Aminicenantes bacterium]NIN19029.1 hypothetical protein [Candidatus Aminicenantes bacterium]NIN42931.1 hypothetical protein [Candidatus Aminicenantes bacterium]NIN85668.1 hypothetical protein [Candidatus Aminicenantes bacterium]
MKKISLFLVLIILTGFGFAAKVGSFPELINPERILVDGGKIFITEGIHVFIYSLKDLKLVKKVGKEGEGPQEFKRFPWPWLPSLRVFLQPDRIFVNSMSKVSFFTREGKFIKERKKQNVWHVFMPFEDKYIVFALTLEKRVSYITYSLYDSDFNKEKEVFREVNPDQEGKKMDPILMSLIKQVFFRFGDGGKFFFPGFDNKIHIFDKTGNDVGTIDIPCSKVPVTSELKNKFIDYFKRDIRYKQVFEFEKNRMKYPNHLPLLKDYRVGDGKVYVIGNKKENEKYETFIYDLDGKLLKKVWLPLVDKDILELYPFTIAGGKLYQLIENEDEEEWELHVTEIK